MPFLPSLFQPFINIFEQTITEYMWYWHLYQILKLITYISCCLSFSEASQSSSVLNPGISPQSDFRLKQPLAGMVWQTVFTLLNIYFWIPFVVWETVHLRSRERGRDNKNLNSPAILAAKIQASNLERSPMRDQTNSNCCQFWWNQRSKGQCFNPATVELLQDWEVRDIGKLPASLVHAFFL